MTGIALHLQMLLEVLTVLFQPIPELRVPVHFLCFLCLLSPILWLSGCRSLISLIKFIPKYFIVSDATINGIFFISFSENSLLVCGNTTDFCTRQPQSAMLVCRTSWWQGLLGKNNLQFLIGPQNSSCGATCEARDQHSLSLSYRSKQVSGSYSPGTSKDE